MTVSTITSYLKDIDVDWIIRFSKERGEPPWVLDNRLRAFKNFQALPWPDHKSDLWKRTGLPKLEWEKLRIQPAELKNLSFGDFPRELASLSGCGQTNVNAPGCAIRQFSKGVMIDAPKTVQQAGVEWLTLEEAIQKKAEPLRKAWSKVVGEARHNKFKSLNLALANGGFCLFVPKGRILKTPLHHFLSGGQTFTAHFPLNFIFVGENSQAHIWEELISEPAQGDEHVSFVSSSTWVDLDENSNASFYYLQHWDSNTIHFQFQDIYQKAFSRLNAVHIAVGGSIFHNECHMNLIGTGAENKVLGVHFGDRSQNFENWITQNHSAEQTKSDIQVRGALKGKSTSFFSGMVNIHGNAQKSDAYQSAKALLLSKDARAEAIPNLEILADDVKCAHGAAMGSVDEDQKYYLQTRGLSPEAAEEIIIQGFFEPVIAEVPSESVQERLRAFIGKKLES